MGVLRAVESVNSVIGPGIIGMEATLQQEIDKKMIEMGFEDLTDKSSFDN